MILLDSEVSGQPCPEKMLDEKLTCALSLDWASLGCDDYLDWDYTAMEVIQRIEDSPLTPLFSEFQIDSPQLPLDSPQLPLETPLLPGNARLIELQSPLSNNSSPESQPESDLQQSPVSDKSDSPLPSPSKSGQTHDTSPRLRHYLETTRSKVTLTISKATEQLTQEKTLCTVCGEKTGIVRNGIYQCENCCLTPSPASELVVNEIEVVSSPPTEELVVKGGKSSSPALKFPPCSVCGGKASGLHYGVNSCEACKGFFRRYLLRNEEYKCSKGGNCPITNRSRGNCSGCRLVKCLSLGMSKHASRLGRYTLSQRTKTIMEVKELEYQGSPPHHTDPDGSPPTSTPGRRRRAGHATPRSPTSKGCAVSNGSPSDGGAPCGGWTEEHESLLQILMSAMDDIKPYGVNMTSEDMVERMKGRYEKYKLKVELFGNMKAVSQEEYYSFLTNYGIDLDGRWEVLKSSKDELEGIIARYVSFAKQVPGFSSLPLNDQSNLLKVARFDFFMILMHKGYMPEYQVFLAHNGEAYHLEEAADRFFSRKLVVGILDIYERWQKLELRPEEIPILMALSLTFPDRCKLENREQVETMQKLMVENLWGLLQRLERSSAAKRFAKMIDCFVALREISEMYFKEYKMLCKNDLIIEEVPMMMEFFLEDW